MIVDGKGIAADLLGDVRSKLPRELVVRAIVAKPSPATESYLSIKSARAADAGMRLEVVRLADDADTAAAIAAVEAPGADAVIVQLPLPASIDQQAVVDAIPLEKDADVLSAVAYAHFEQGEAGAVIPPVAAAIGEILSRSGVDLIHGKRVVIIGRGKLVGKPAAAWFLQQGASVEVIDRSDGSLGVLKEADIIVSGAGQAGLITSDLIQEGVVLIDAGTSESNGSIAGDADPACADVASVFTPVPGGVGPIAVACLFYNVARLQGF